MQYDFTLFKDREKEVLEWLGTEYARIQSGRITAALLDHVEVRAYGAKTLLGHCAAITMEDPKTLMVAPYDAVLLSDIETALREQVPTMGVAVGETAVRVISPEVTGERRTILERNARERMEEAKQSVRGIREKVLADIKKKKGDAVLSEDEEFVAKEELQKKVDAVNEDIEERYTAKLRDIQT